MINFDEQISRIIHKGHPAKAKQPPVQWPSLLWIFSNVHRLLAFGLGSGWLRPMPGTWGTLGGWIAWIPLSLFLKTDLIAMSFLACAFLYGVYACHYVSKELGVSDHSGIVWDEWVAFWLVLFFVAPLNYPILWSVIGFFLFRFYDIVKPWPIRFFDQLFENGFGIMVDDLFAAFYTLFTIALILRIMDVLL